MSINPMARGILVVPVEKEFMIPADPGKKKPMAMPIAIARKIQSVRYLSRKLNCFLSPAGAQLLADII
jgi:hypothetical protein